MFTQKLQSTRSL